jgi:hypothetical protein
MLYRSKTYCAYQTLITRDRIINLRLELTTVAGQQKPEAGYAQPVRLRLAMRGQSGVIHENKDKIDIYHVGTATLQVAQLELALGLW